MKNILCQGVRWNLEMTEHRRSYLGFLKWSCCNRYSGAYKIVCKASQVLQVLQPVLARICICFVQVDKNRKTYVSELAELGSYLCPKHCSRKSGPSEVHGETAPDLNQQGF